MSGSRLVTTVHSARCQAGWRAFLTACAVVLGTTIAHAQSVARAQPPRPAAAGTEPARPPQKAASPAVVAQRASADSIGSPGISLPPYSIRFDPLNWLIQGRFDMELEMAFWKYLSVELAPSLVVNDTPATFAYGGRDEPVTQHSDGLGPLAGASVGIGFWPFGIPLQGYVVRLNLSNVGMSYRVANQAGEFDRVDRVERRLQLLFGSHSRFDWFTISGGIGLGLELSGQRRCFRPDEAGARGAVSTGCDGDQLEIKLDPDANSVSNLNGSLHPVYILARLSVGVAFD